MRSAVHVAAGLAALLLPRDSLAMREMDGSVLEDNSGANATQGLAVLSDLKAGTLFLDRYLLKSKLGYSWPQKFYDNIVPKHEAGAGAFGVTFLALDKHSNMEVAVKFFHTEEVDGREGSLLSYTNAGRNKWKLDMAAEECQIPKYMLMARLDFPEGQERINRCLLNGVKNTETVSYLVLEYAGSTNLREYADKYGLSGAELVRVAKLLLEGAKQMAGKWVHRDIKPENVMIYREKKDGELYIKYIDFGLSIPEGASRSGTAGTPGFMPPSIFPKAGPNYRPTAAHDIYAIGMTLSDLMCKGWTAFDAAQQLKKDFKNVVPNDYCRPLLKDENKPLYKVMVDSMALKQQSAEWLLEQPIFAGIKTMDDKLKEMIVKYLEAKKAKIVAKKEQKVAKKEQLMAAEMEKNKRRRNAKTGQHMKQGTFSVVKFKGREGEDSDIGDEGKPVHAHMTEETQAMPGQESVQDGFVDQFFQKVREWKKKFGFN